MNHFLNSQQLNYFDELNSFSSLKAQTNKPGLFITNYERDQLSLIKKRKEIERKLNEGLYNYSGVKHQKHPESTRSRFYTTKHLSSSLFSNIDIQHDSDERNINHDLRKRIKVDDEFKLRNSSQYFDLKTNDIDQRSLDSDIRKNINYFSFNSAYKSKSLSIDRSLSPPRHRLHQTNDQDMRNESDNNCQLRIEFKEAQDRKEMLKFERERIQKKLNESEKRMSSSLKPLNLVEHIIKKQKSDLKAEVAENGKEIYEKLKLYTINSDEEAEMVKEIIKLLNDSLLRYELTNISSEVLETFKEVLEKES